MDVRLLRRPLVDLTLGHSQYLLTGNVAARRHESSYRRTKKLLNVKPDDTFIFSKSTPKLDHMIFNPPPSVPSVLHTPLKFLPKDDKRRNLLADAATSTLASPLRLPLAEKPKLETFQRHHLTEEDVKEMRRLRALDPEKFTSGTLARKFNTTSLFVRVCTQHPERHEASKKMKKELLARMGPRKKKAWEDRTRRWEMIYKDE